MTTDTNLSQIVFNRLSNEKYHELKTSGQLNDQQFYITPDLDTNPGLIQDYMSNCITKIPQHINLELSTDGTLTLKAGSIVYYGDNSFTIIQQDISQKLTISSVDTYMLFYTKYSNIITFNRINTQTDSGTTTPTSSYWAYYNTNDKKVYDINDGVNAGELSLPIAIITSDSTTVTSIDQVFNGIGYIGAVAFAVPGVQVIIPNGFNSNGQLNNYTATVERVLTKDYAADNILGQNLPLTLTNSPLLSAGDMIYVEEENQIYKGSIAELSKRTEVEIAKVTTDSTRITSLTPLPIYNRILGSYDLTNKANTDLSNVSSNIDYVVEQGEINNITWEKWKSGKLIQRGKSTVKKPNWSETFTFAKPYANSDYNIDISLYNPNEDQSGGRVAYIKSKTTTSFVGGVHYSASAGTGGVEWIAIGQGA